MVDETPVNQEREGQQKLDHSSHREHSAADPGRTFKEQDAAFDSNRSKSERRRKRREKGPDWVRLIFRIAMHPALITAYFTGILGIVALVQAVVLYFTLQTSNKSVEATLKYANTVDDTEHRQLRAYLLASYAELNEVKYGKATVTVHFKNSGQTPAKGMAAVTNFSFDNLAHPRKVAGEIVVAENPLEKPSRSDIGAGGESLMDNPEPLLMVDIADMEAGNTLIQVSGVIVYSDIFGDPHHTWFSFYSDKENGAKPHHFLVSPDGNGFD